MLRNYIKIALRHFGRNQATSIINVLGLSLGLATCLVAGLYIKHELSADRFHENYATIHRVYAQMQQFTMNGSPYLFAETIDEMVPEIEATLRTADLETTVKINDEMQKHKIVFADPNIFTFFTFPLAEGNRANALTGLKQIVISHEMKQKYFSSEPALGKQIAIWLDDKFEDFEVTGVAKPTPAYSSMYFDFVIPIENRFAKTPQVKNDWGMFFITTFLQIKPENVSKFHEAMPAFASKYFPSDQEMKRRFQLAPFSEHHLGGHFGGAGLRNGKSGETLYVFGGIAIAILLLACFNFMNLTNAQSSRRAIEVGIKKVVGAMKGQLVRQFLAEALVLSTIASLLALGLAELSLFMFRDLLQVSISLFDANNLDVFFGLIAITVLTGVLAGLYPAFVLSNIHTLKTFKRQFTVGGSNWITRSILSLQFAISIVLIVCAVVMWRQQQYINNKDLGFNMQQVVAVKFPENQVKMMDGMKNELRAMSETMTVCKATTSFNGQSSIFHHTTKDSESSFLYVLSADDEFFNTMQMKFVKGKGFDASSASVKSTIVVNETLLKKLNLEDSVGVQLNQTLAAVSNPTIVGVVKDFHHSAAKYEIGPMVIIYDQPLGDGYLLVRLADGKTKQGLDKIQTIWNKNMPDTPFEFSFVDENVQRQYEDEMRWSSIISLSTGMAIFLSMLGLLGLAMFTAEQRKKEIGIRKVLGASMTQLVNLLSKDYVLLIIISFVVSAPASWYIMNNYWLNNFAYKIEVDWFVYAIALLIVLLVAALSIGSQTVRAALQNPADTLKEE